jgi:hypothetical protein
VVISGWAVIRPESSMESDQNPCFAVNLIENQLYTRCGALVPHEPASKELACFANAAIVSAIFACQV